MEYRFSHSIKLYVGIHTYNSTVYLLLMFPCLLTGHFQLLFFLPLTWKKKKKKKKTIIAQNTFFRSWNALPCCTTFQIKNWRASGKNGASIWYSQSVVAIICPFTSFAYHNTFVHLSVNVWTLQDLITRERERLKLAQTILCKMVESSLQASFISYKTIYRCNRCAIYWKSAVMRFSKSTLSVSYVTLRIYSKTCSKIQFIL